MRKELLTRIIACPRCKRPLADDACPACDLRFPNVDGVPVLIDDERSLFRAGDFVSGRDTTYNSSVPGWKRSLKRLIPSLNLNVRSRTNFAELRSRLESAGRRFSVLVIGGAVEGDGIEALLGSPMIDLIETDVAVTPRTDTVCDAHDLAFVDGSFDAVIIQAVLEHVLDPFRCVEEIHRVLKPGGIVYAETPFMAPVHAGRFDFLRFSHLAHRRLFRRFSEFGSGATCGPGMALGWSYCYFLQSFASGETARQIAFAFAGFTGFWLKYFDYFLIDRPGTFDAGLSYYFLGEKSDATLDDRELIAAYRGLYR